MRVDRPGVRSWAAAVTLALLGGCAAPVPLAIPGTVTVKAVEEAAWSAQPEPGLYRVTWDAEGAREILRRAGEQGAPESVDSYMAERLQLDVEADRALKDRGLCREGSAKLHTILEIGARGGPISGIFKCRPPVF
jgi:hypothetical protein